MQEFDEVVDIAVVGAGIGGSYTCWKLREREFRISLFEYSDRVGGRIFCPPLPVAPGTTLDFGAKRFLQERHPLFTAVSKELGLKIIPFPLNFGNPDETIWYLRNKHMREADLGNEGMPYNLDPTEQQEPTTLLKKLFFENANYESKLYPGDDELYSLTTKDGTPLYEMSYNNFMADCASHEARQYLKDTSGWMSSISTMTALHAPKIFLSCLDTSISPDLSTIEGGMEKVVQTLVERFIQESKKHTLHLNHQLIGIERRPSGGYSLRFRKTQTKDGVTTPLEGDGSVINVVAKKVILAAQRDCLKQIDIPFFKNNPQIMTAFDSVVGKPNGKIFLAYETKWWKTGNEDITHTRTDLPNQQTYDWQTGSNGVSIILASYHDGEATRHWRELSKFGTPIPGSLPGDYAVTDVVKERLEKYLSRIFNIKQEDIPPAVGGGMMLWDTYPYKYGWEFFKPGVDERKVLPLIPKPSPEDDVYIVSNSWAPGDLAIWAEGSLQASEFILQKYFNL